MLTPRMPTPPPSAQVVPGQSIVEVKPQGISKGRVVDRILADSASREGGPPDFVLCIGNDRSGGWAGVRVPLGKQRCLWVDRGAGLLLGPGLLLGRRAGQGLGFPVYTLSAWFPHNLV